MSFFNVIFLVTREDWQKIFSAIMVQKIFGLLSSQYIDYDGRLNAIKAIRTLGEQLCMELIIHYTIDGQDDTQVAQGWIFFSKLFFILICFLFI